jgi:hypothetical protein
MFKVPHIEDAGIMKTKKHLWLCLALFAASLSLAPAHAQYYGGLKLKPVEQSVFDGEYTGIPGLFSSTANPGQGRYGLRLNYRVAPHLAVEGGYAELGRPPFMGANAFSPNRPRASGFDVGVVGTLPVFDKFSLLGRASVSRLNGVSGIDLASMQAFNLDAVYPAGLRSGTAGRMALGLQYDFNRSLGLRFEMVRRHAFGGNQLIGESDSDGFSFGVSFKF